MNDLPPELVKAVPGVAGSLVSMLFIKDSWPRRLAMFAAGAVLSSFGTPWASRLSGLDAGFAGFVLGLFGMAVVAKVFEWWSKFDLGGIALEWIRKMLGLPPKEA